MQIRKINGLVAHCCALGTERDVSLFMMQDETLAVGDFVIIHLGYATQKVPEQEALDSWRLFAEILAELGPAES